MLTFADGTVNQLVKQEKSGAKIPSFSWNSQRTAYDNRTRQALEMGCVPGGVVSR